MGPYSELATTVVRAMMGSGGKFRYFIREKSTPYANVKFYMDAEYCRWIYE